MLSIIENICPVCNGLITLEDLCPNCREIMEEDSTPKDQLEPYAPYEQERTYNLPEGECIHLIMCPNCEATWNITVNKIDF